ncbi:MAG: tetratricopeptide repeat protein [Thiobacillaceae bacterium]
MLLLLLGLALPAAADGLQDAGQLFRQGKHASALAKVDAYLADNPKDAQGRFLKGLILTELNRHAEAIKVFSDLTIDYPQLPEPYNNLAVLYAAQGQYERAKQSLEQAIRTHPSYATAHENLGDVYAKMASLAYDRALQLDESNVSAQTKLALIRELFSPTRTADAGRAEAGRAEARTVTGKTPAKTAVARPTQKASAAREREEEPPPSAGEAVAEAQTAPVQTTVAAAGGATAQAGTASAAREAIEATVRAWAQAWSRQDVPAYLAFYGRGFTPPRSQDRAAWEAQRTQRLQKPSRIRVEVSDLRVEVRGDKAQARFRQRYESDRLQGTYNKTLDLALEGGEWKIVRER